MIELTERGGQIDAAWQGRGVGREERSYKAFELEALRISSRLFRGLEGGAPNFTTSEFLRTLGRELDQIGIIDIHIKETSDGYEFSGTLNGSQVGRLYPFEELITRAREFYRARGIPMSK